MDLSSEQSGGIDTVLAATIRIDRLAEAYVRGGIAADDAARGFSAYLGAQAGGRELFAFIHFPAVVHCLADGALEAPGKVGAGPSAFDRDTHVGSLRRCRLSGCDNSIGPAGQGPALPQSSAR